jgi:small subunit ribosomal protein S4
VAIAPDSPVADAARAASELTGAIAPWLEADIDRLRGKVLRTPRRSEITVPVNEHLIIEFYARR